MFQYREEKVGGADEGHSFISDLGWVVEHQKLSSGELYSDLYWSLSLLGVALHRSSGTH